MNDLEFAAMLVSRVCHDLVSPVGAVVNGLEVLEDERDAGMRADALKLVASSAEQAAARLQFARVAFGAAGSAGAELDLNEVGRVVKGLVNGGKVEIDWQAAPLNWPKDWAKLLMNATVLAIDSLPRGGLVKVETSANPTAPGFTVRATRWPVHPGLSHPPAGAWRECGADLVGARRGGRTRCRLVKTARASFNFNLPLFFRIRAHSVVDPRA
jgi:histidine phosphotransferase ChpT